MADLKMKRRGEPVTCPYCETKLPRPAQMQSSTSSTSCTGGRCDCGAVYLLDATGREGGQLIMEGLYFLAGGDMDLALTLRGGTDYDVRGLGYNYRMHVYEPRQRGRSYGQPKLWFFKLASQESDT